MLKKILPILALNFVNILGFSILIPILPSIVESYQGKELMYGLLVSIYSMFQFFASPIMGSLSDFYGRRPVLILSQAGTFISWIIFGSAFFIPELDFRITSLPVLVIMFARMFDGLTGGNTTVAHAYLADITTKKEKTRAFGLVGAVFGVGFLIGPVIGTWSYSTDLSYAGTAIVAAGISLITLILLTFKLPESLPKSKRKKKLKLNLIEEFNLLARIRHLNLSKEMKKLFTFQIFFAMGFSAYVGIIILYFTQHYGVSEQNISLILLGFGMYAILNQTALVPRIADKIGELKTYHIGYSMMIFSMLLITIDMPLWTFIACGYFISFAIDSCTPTFKALISNYMPASKQGEAQGIDEAFQAIGRATAPLISASIYSIINGYTFSIIGLTLLIPIIFIGFAQIPRAKDEKGISEFDNIPFNE